MNTQEWPTRIVLSVGRCRGILLFKHRTHNTLSKRASYAQLNNKYRFKNDAFRSIPTC